MTFIASFVEHSRDALCRRKVDTSHDPPWESVHFPCRILSEPWSHLVSPLLGFGILAYLLKSMKASTWEFGAAWLLIAIIGRVVLERRRRGGLRPEVQSPSP